MSNLLKVKKAQDLSDLARLLDIAPAALSYILYKMPDGAKYKHFEVPKKGGGARQIKAPKQRLAVVQSRLAEFLVLCSEEIFAENPSYQVASHGFRKGRGIISNASQHKKKKYVFNVDIEDFFGSINFGRVRGFFIKDKYFSLNPKVATIIAQIACHDNCLPQGSPCSPVISNLIANILDARLLRLAKHTRCTYTRYADDITFSTNQNFFPKEVAYELVEAVWKSGKRLDEVIEGAGFVLNASKTRMSLRQSCQTVTGLVVNSKPNIRQDYYRSVRAICNSIFKSGFWHYPVLNADEEVEKVENLRPVEGMLSYIYHVKNRTDRSRKQNNDIKFIPPYAPENLYARFLFYKNFVASGKPMLVTEGISDVTYIKCAIRSLYKDFPCLVSEKEGKLELALSFLNPSGVSRSVLDLGNGASGQNKLIHEYENKLKYFHRKDPKSPVIIICDNDEGSKDIFKSMKKMLKITEDFNRNEEFYHIYKNLYIVMVPLLDGARSGDIEDLFDDRIRSEILQGKTFDKSKIHGDHASYGKVIFAEKVVRPNAQKIDFGNFAPLLNRIVSCISHYKKMCDTK